jgi:hypothetical protein
MKRCPWKLARNQGRSQFVANKDNFTRDPPLERGGPGNSDSRSDMEVSAEETGEEMNHNYIRMKAPCPRMRKYERFGKKTLFQTVAGAVWDPVQKKALIACRNGKNMSKKPRGSAELVGTYLVYSCDPLATTTDSSLTQCHDADHWNGQVENWNLAKHMQRPLPES